MNTEAGKRFGDAYRRQLELNPKMSSDEAWAKTIATHRADYDTMMGCSRTAFANSKYGDERAARETLLANARTIQFHNGSHLLGALRVACSVNPGCAKAAALVSDSSIIEFSNSMENPSMTSKSGASDGRAGALPAGSPGGVRPAGPTTAERASRANSSKNENGVALSEIERLQLPVDCSQEEYSTAKAFNTSDPVKLFNSMCSYAKTSRGYDSTAAQAFCAGRFPKLFQAWNADRIAKS